MISLTRSHRKQILEIALMDETPFRRKKIKEVLNTISKISYGLPATRNELINITGIITRTIAAISALEERTQ